MADGWKCRKYRQACSTSAPFSHDQTGSARAPRRGAGTSPLPNLAGSTPLRCLDRCHRRADRCRQRLHRSRRRNPGARGRAPPGPHSPRNLSEESIKPLKGKDMKEKPALLGMPSPFRRCEAFNLQRIPIALGRATRGVQISVSWSFMKTTLDLRDDLLSKAKQQAAKEQISLTRMIEEGLTLRLRRSRNHHRQLKPLPLSRRKGGLRKGVDGRSNKSLFDAADG
jgi:hypothetical protein